MKARKLLNEGKAVVVEYKLNGTIVFALTLFSLLLNLNMKFLFHEKIDYFGGDLMIYYMDSSVVVLLLLIMSWMLVYSFLISMVCYRCLKNNGLIAKKSTWECFEEAVSVLISKTKTIFKINGK